MLVTLSTTKAISSATPVSTSTTTNNIAVTVVLAPCFYRYRCYCKLDELQMAGTHVLGRASSDNGCCPRVLSVVLSPMALPMYSNCVVL